jgi:hypothetical protein
MIRRRHAAFTLFELILAIALSVVLLGLIGTAINLYLTRVSMSRDRVEEAQLARSILSMIAEDLRATAVYQPQDVSDVAQLMAQSASFDVDSIDAARTGGSGGNSSALGSLSALQPLSSSGTAGAAGGSTSGGGTGATTGNTDTSGGSAEYESEMPLGVNGELGELYVDIVRLPRGDELFGTLTGYTNAPMIMPADGTQMAAGGTWGTMPSPSDLKTVRYFLREGDRTDATGVAATSLSTEMGVLAGGLVRQEIPRPARLFAEQNANSAVLESGQVLVAPEVVNIEFRYFDGEQLLDIWDMVEQRSLPRAIEVCIWLVSAHEAAASAAAYDARELLSIARPYRQTVFLPMAELSQQGAMAGTGPSPSGQSPTSSSASGTSASSSTTSSSSSSFGSSTN